MRGVLPELASGFLVLAACGGSGVEDSGGETDGGATTSQSQSAGPSGGPASASSSASSGSSSGAAETEGESSDGESTGEPPDDPYDAELEWEPCPLFTGTMGSEAECATVDVPADWGDIDGPTLELFVKRYGAIEGDKQLWMLMGGPGGSAQSFEFSADLYTQFDEGLTVYMLDHRGTGRSTLLECPDQEAAASEDGRIITLDETPGCTAYLEATYGDLLQHFSTTGAANDLGWLIDQVREQEAVHVFGSSYGTYWANRYLQLFPDQADSASLLGIAPPDFTFTTFDIDFNEVGESFMEACGDDPFCSARLGSDPVATMRSIFDMVDAGQCAAAGLDRTTLRVYFSSLLSWAGDERARIPATLYRLQRCNAADVAALQNAAPFMADPLGGLFNDPLFSMVINRHISFSEMWEAPFPTDEEIEAWETELLFSVSSSTSRYEIFPLWPTYPQPKLDNTLAETDIPMLMFNGEFDPNSPTFGSDEVGAHFDGPNQHYFVLPDGNHGWYSPTTDGYGCAETVFFNFIQDPTQPLFDCMELITPLDWSGSPTDAQSFFGTNDLYD